VGMGCGDVGWEERLKNIAIPRALGGLLLCAPRSPRATRLSILLTYNVLLVLSRGSQ